MPITDHAACRIVQLATDVAYVLPVDASSGWPASLAFTDKPAVVTGPQSIAPAEDNFSRLGLRVLIRFDTPELLEDLILALRRLLATMGDVPPDAPREGS